MIAGSLQDEAAITQAELEQYLDQQSQDVEDEFDLLHLSNFPVNPRNI